MNLSNFINYVPNINISYVQTQTNKKYNILLVCWSSNGQKYNKTTKYIFSTYDII